MFIDGKWANDQGVNTLAVSSHISAPDELGKYKKLLDDGAITQEEYDRKKAQLL